MESKEEDDLVCADVQWGLAKTLVHLKWSTKITLVFHEGVTDLACFGGKIVSFCVLLLSSHCIIGERCRPEIVNS